MADITFYRPISDSVILSNKLCLVDISVIFQLERKLNQTQVLPPCILLSQLASTFLLFLAFDILLLSWSFLYRKGTRIGEAFVKKFKSVAHKWSYLQGTWVPARYETDVNPQLSASCICLWSMISVLSQWEPQRFLVLKIYFSYLSAFSSSSWRVGEKQVLTTWKPPAPPSPLNCLPSCSTSRKL